MMMLLVRLRPSFLATLHHTPCTVHRTPYTRHHSHVPGVRYVYAVSRHSSCFPLVNFRCKQAVSAGKSVLVFCATKKSSQHCAQFLAAALSNSTHPNSARGTGGAGGGAGAGGNMAGRAGDLHSGVPGLGRLMEEGSVEWERREAIKLLRQATCGSDAVLRGVVAAGLGSGRSGSADLCSSSSKQQHQQQLLLLLLS